MNINGRILWSHLKMPGVTVSVQPSPKPQVYMFRVASVLDMGCGNRTAVLEPFRSEDGFRMEPMDPPCPRKTRLSIPHKVGKLSFLYASKHLPEMTDLDYVVGCAFTGRKVDRIVLDVLAPGDLIAVRPKRRGGGIASLEPLRVVSRIKKQKGLVSNAL